MSHTTAIGRGRVRRCQKRHTRGSPPAPSERLSMARAARRRPRPARRRRRDGRSAKRGRKSASIAAASRASAGVSSAKSAVRSCSSALAPSRVVSATTSVTSTPGGASGPKLTSARGPSFWRNRGSSADTRPRAVLRRQNRSNAASYTTRCSRRRTNTARPAAFTSPRRSKPSSARTSAKRRVWSVSTDNPALRSILPKRTTFAVRTFPSTGSPSAISLPSFRHSVAFRPRTNLIQQLRRSPTLQRRHILLVLEQRTQGVLHLLGLEPRGAERFERGRPVDGLRDAGGLGEVRRAQPLHERHHVRGEGRGQLRPAAFENRELALRRRVVDPVIQAAALERVVHLARAVARDDDVRRPLGFDRPDLGDGDREVGEHFEQVRLELLVRAVDLVDQQDGRLGTRVLERPEQRATDQELLREDVFGRRLLRLAARLEQADLEHLTRIVPFVHGGVDVEPLVAL